MFVLLHINLNFTMKFWTDILFLNLLKWKNCSFYTFWYFFLKAEHLLKLTFSWKKCWFWLAIFFQQKSISSKNKQTNNLNQLKNISYHSQYLSCMNTTQFCNQAENGRTCSSPAVPCGSSAPLSTLGLFLTCRLICHVLQQHLWAQKSERKDKM